ncbi:MAG: prepilin-type N-terminal cleavage/methylation domain-containing protein [bacterium]|nr:prepilin-type N-terminal cleavage/methylation domain-containing protein [bacterium]
MKTNRSTQKGFTLVELIIVIAIIAVLAVVAVSTFGGAQRNSRDARRRADVKQIQNAAERYFENCRLYPASPADFILLAAGCAAGSGVVQHLSAGAFPRDPRALVADGAEGNYEVVAATSTTYQICADLEIDPDSGVIDPTWAIGQNENDFCLTQLQQ